MGEPVVDGCRADAELLLKLHPVDPDHGPLEEREPLLVRKLDVDDRYLVVRRHKLEGEPVPPCVDEVLNGGQVRVILLQPVVDRHLGESGLLRRSRSGEPERRHEIAQELEVLKWILTGRQGLVPCCHRLDGLLAVLFDILSGGHNAA